MLKNILKTLLFCMILSTFILKVFPQTIPNSDFDKEENFRMDLPFKLCQILEKNTDEFNHLKVASDNENLFLYSTGGILKSVKLNQQINWSIDLGGDFVARPYIFDGNIIITSKIEKPFENKDSYVVRLLDKKTGLVKWQLVTQIPNLTSKNYRIFFNHSKNQLIMAVENGDLFLINMQKGKIITKNSLDSSLSTVPFFGEESFVLGTINKEIIQISNVDIKEISKVIIPETPSAVCILGRKIIYGTFKGKLISFEASSNYPNLKFKNRWTLQVGGKISEIMIVNDELLISSFDNYIYKVSANRGEIVWKQRLDNRPAFVPLLIQNYAVVTAVGESIVLIVELKSGRIINRINISDGNFLSDSSGRVFLFVYFPTNSGILFYTSQTVCPLVQN